MSSVACSEPLVIWTETVRDHLNTSRGSSGGKEDVKCLAKQTDEVDETVKERRGYTVHPQLEFANQVYCDGFKEVV